MKSVPVLLVAKVWLVVVNPFNEVMAPRPAAVMATDAALVILPLASTVM